MGSNALEGSQILTVVSTWKFKNFSKRGSRRSLQWHQGAQLELINRDLLAFMLHFFWLMARVPRKPNFMSILCV